jgi:hypothetical protein
MKNIKKQPKRQQRPVGQSFADQDLEIIFLRQVRALHLM